MLWILLWSFQGLEGSSLTQEIGIGQLLVFLGFRGSSALLVLDFQGLKRTFNVQLSLDNRINNTKIALLFSFT